MRGLKTLETLTIASLRMYVRQREAILWAVLLPLFIVILFSFLRFDGLGRLQLGVVNDAGAAGAALAGELRAMSALTVREGSRAAEVRALERGERDLVLVLPAGMERDSGATLLLYADSAAKPRETQLGVLILQHLLDERYFQATRGATRAVVRMTPVSTRNLTYIDFLIPGVIAMTIMQLGVFGVAFGFVSLKKRGILRRLWVTPIRPRDFIIAQVITRLVVMLAQMTILLGVGTLFLHLHIVGSVLLLAVTALLGSVVFLGIGFAIAGVSSSEDQVAPIANVLTLPMLVLSGVFFNRSALPDALHAVTSVLPLTFLADALRAVAVDGATLDQVATSLLGLIVWGVITVAIAARVFRWE